MRILYFGDGLWATKCLQRLLDNNHQVVAVILRCKPSDSTLEELALQVGIPVRTVDKVNTSDFVNWVYSQKPDLNISMSYDQIFHKPILQTAPKGFINCHAGNLPYYRGRNVLNWAIINNEKEIGLTILYVDEGIDTGDIILQRHLLIDWEDNYGTVLAKVQDAFPELLAEAVTLIKEDRVQRQPQSHLEGTYFCARHTGDEWIDWNDTSLNIYNKIRAITQPGPGARTILGNKVLIIWNANYDLDWPKYTAIAGEVVRIEHGKGIRLKTGDSTIMIKRTQFENEDIYTPSFPIGTRFGV